jgi:Pseudouridylate synthase
VLPRRSIRACRTRSRFFRPRGAGGLPRPSFRALAQLRYRLFTRATPSPFELRRSWWFPRPLDEEALAAAAAELPGKHDFRAFTPTQTKHEVFIRVVQRAEWIRRGEHLDFEITADSYLRHMVRSLVGTMVDVPATLPELLDGRSRPEAGATAPPCGLYLVSVAY